MQAQAGEKDDFYGLKNGSYFYITNRETKLAMAYDTDSENPHLFFNNLDTTCPDQIWMIEEVQQNKYQIVHAYSTLVLTVSRKGARLSHGNRSSDQLFFVQKSNAKQSQYQYWIKQNKTSDKHLFYEIAMKCDIVNPKASKARWELKRINQNNELLKSCLMQFAYSGMYLDVPGSSIRQGEKIIQFPLNARSNQRWKVVKNRQKNAFAIISVRSKKCLTVDKGKAKVGTLIKQQNVVENADHQLWKLHHQGKNLYIIESSLKPGLFLGIKGNSMNEGDALVTTDQQQYAFWRVIGPIEQP